MGEAAVCRREMNEAGVEGRGNVCVYRCRAILRCSSGKAKRGNRRRVAHFPFHDVVFPRMIITYSQHKAGGPPPTLPAIAHPRTASLSLQTKMRGADEINFPERTLSIMLGRAA